MFYVQAAKGTAMPSEIARWLSKEPQTITSILDRMQKKGLIKKTHDRKRKNVFRVALTAKGKQAYEAIAKAEGYHIIFSALSGEKRQALKEILTELSKSATKLTRELIQEGVDSY
jgi:DNA-binding MarR family transcriptional regulator